MALTQECDSYKGGVCVYVCVLMCLFWGALSLYWPYCSNTGCRRSLSLSIEGPYRCLYAYMTWMTMINGSGSALC